ARVKVFPQRASGFFRRLKWWILALALGIYWITPWIRWDRGPEAPSQAVLVDLAHRRFYFFFIEIWPQEFYYVAGLLIMAGLGLFLMTSVVGRAWCGYACWQTVWTDLYISVERWIEGDRNARMRLDKAPWSFEKIRKRLAVHTIWLLIAMATGGTWIFYFADAPTLMRQFITLQAPPVAYTTVGILTATTYIFAGFMREQVCTYMCPWPRIQGAMLDEDSLIVTYNGWRGEPRSAHRKKAQAQGKTVGDCIACNACVAVCPMGIDIRDGEQLECISCALCIDACNTMMDKVGLARGLISYSTLRDYNAHVADAETTSPQQATANQRKVHVSHIVRPRTLVYSGLWSLIGIAMLVSLSLRERLDLNVLHDRNPLFVTLSDGSIRNGFIVKILNMKGEARTFELHLEGLDGAEMWLAGEEQQRGRSLEMPVEADKLREFRVFVSQPRDAIKPGRADFDMIVRDRDGTESVAEDAQFYAPE
ncbi:MAG TPA: cytochrome c oxidase accessory protein CcoG, partial [Afifellaceae bacterium]|nr:cytochrome c oxidase accessory protein CcoG [Afifellaceae bacterium]